MDHDYIEAHGLVEQYLQGGLEDPERERFEAHFIDCPVCLEALEWAEDLGGAVRAAAITGATVDARFTPAAGWTRWLEGMGPMRRRALVAAALLALLVVPWSLGRYQGHWRALEVASPRPDAPLVYLSATRDGGLDAGPGASLQRVRLPAEPGESLLLVMEVGEVGSFPSYGGRLETTAGEVLWSTESWSSVNGSSRNSFTLALPARFLEPGDYRLVLTGLRPGRASAELATYGFRAASPAVSSSGPGSTEP